MWQRICYSFVWRRAPSYRIAAGAVAYLVLSEAERRRQKDKQLSIRDLTDNESLSDSSRHQSVLHGIAAPPISWLRGSVNVAQCDLAMSVSRLARHRTLRRIEETSSKSTLESRYDVNWSNPLGEGAFGAVYEARDRKTGETVAVKKIGKKFTDDVSFQREMNALLHIRNNGGHPNICSLRENFNEGDSYILVLDLVSGGEMFDHLVNQGAYSEADAARLVREMASALAFLHGIGCVHSDMKPENSLMSTEHQSDAVIKLVDFGCAQVTADDSAFPSSKKKGETTNTPAYCPPEVLDKKRAKSSIDPSFDMWSLGIILYIMLTGVHPFDLEGNASDDEIKRAVLKKKAPPLKGSPITAHLSPDAIDVIQKLLMWNPNKRMTALEMLEHPWVRGETARRNKMADSAEKLAKYRVYKSRLEAKVFEDIVTWSDAKDDDATRRTSLIERSFRSFDPQHKGYITESDLRRLTGKDATDGPRSTTDDEGVPLSLSGFSDLLSDHMQNKYFPKGHIICRQGETGNSMYLINSGTVEISTRKGFRTELGQGQFFGEGALLHPKRIRSSTIRCVTPVHAIEISREYFNKYLASTGESLSLNLREKNKTRNENRAKTILRLQQNLREVVKKHGDYLFKAGEQGNELFIIEEGHVDVYVEDHVVYRLNPGDLCGEHALIFSRPRNASAICVSDECKLQVMSARDFLTFLDSAPWTKESLHDLAQRREFQKAIVFKTKRAFPSDPKDLRGAFDAADEDNSGFLSLENVRSMLKRMDPSLTEKEVKSILKALDLDESGQVSFEEFRRIFRYDDATAPSC